MVSMLANIITHVTILKRLRKLLLFTPYMPKHAVGNTTLFGYTICTVNAVAKIAAYIPKGLYHELPVKLLFSALPQFCAVEVDKK